MLLVALISLIGGATASIIAGSRNRSRLGFFFAGWFGIIVLSIAIRAGLFLLGWVVTGTPLSEDPPENVEQVIKLLSFVLGCVLGNGITWLLARKFIKAEQQGLAG